jgi:hypothetical protein
MYRKLKEVPFSQKYRTAFLRDDYHDNIMKIIADTKLITLKGYNIRTYFYYPKRIFGKLTGKNGRVKL